VERTLSPNESKIVLELEWQNKKVVTIDEIAKLLGVSKNYAYKLASQLRKKRWLFPISRGKFQLIPAEAGREEPVPEMNAAIFLGTIEGPYYVSYAFANNFYGFTSQIPSTIIVVKPAQEKYSWKREKRFHNVAFRYIDVKREKFFGYTKVDLLGISISMAEKEKALIDSLDKIRYAGGTEEVSEVFQAGLPQVDIERLTNYAFRMGSKALIQRLRARDIYDLWVLSNRPMAKERVRTLSVLKCWQVREEFDPEKLLSQISSAKFEWQEIQRLVRKDKQVHREEATKTCLSEYAFLEELTQDEKRLAKDSHKHELKDLYSYLCNSMRKR